MQTNKDKSNDSRATDSTSTYRSSDTPSVKSSLMNPEEAPHEGALTKTVEAYTAKIPSMAWLMLAVGSMAISGGLAAMKNKKGAANFVGLWVPSLLLLGVYNKLVKLEGSDRFSRENLH